MEFEWDENKTQSNIAKHGIAFETAVRIFQGPTLDQIDARNDYGEKRAISLGTIENVLILVVVHTDRGGITRIISARPVNSTERHRYGTEISKRTDA
jgi:hypothetical protein